MGDPLDFQTEDHEVVDHKQMGLDQLCDHVRRLDRVLLTTHPAPDGDAIGSVTALGLALNISGCDVVMFNVDEVPGYLSFVPGADRFETEIATSCPKHLLVLDASDSRVLPPSLAATDFESIVVIDHHRTIGDLGQIAYRDEGAAATGVLIYRLLKRLGLEISEDIATALFVAISSDTGSFRFQNTDAECFSIANDLVSLGANPGAISESLAPKRSCVELKHIGQMLSSVVMLNNNKVAVIDIDDGELLSKALSPRLGGGVIQLMRQIPGVEVAATVRRLAGEHLPPRFKVSMRSTGSVDVSRVAVNMGGGGHFYAAGATIEMADFSCVHEKIVAELAPKAPAVNAV